MRRLLIDIYERLYRAYGLAWWPGETPFEVMVAPSSSDTSWINVEKAIPAPQGRRRLTVTGIHQLKSRSWRLDSILLATYRIKPTA